MKKILVLFALIPFFVFSQSKIVTGTVNDENNLPLVGVNITVDNSNIGALTDFDGNYTISIPSNLPKKLTFSYLGYTTQEIDVSATDNMSIMMIPDLTQLEEVVVVGYGSVLKKDLTGALSTVEVEDEVANQSNSIDQLLQGRAAGVQVVQNAATPGGGISVKIRGTNSLRGNNEPLYVVDGVIISSAGEDVLPAGVGNLGQESQNGLAGINPRDIESIQVLKDASATAIYGSRGANGVVVITTKKGMEGKVKIEGFSNSSVRMITKKYNVLDPYGFAEYANEVNANNGLGPRYFVDGLDIYGVESTGVVAGTPAQLFHWQDEVYTEGISTKVGASASGGTDGGNYYISAGFDNQEGVVPTSSFKSGDMRINFNQDLNDKLRLEARMSAYLSSTNFAEGGDLIGSANQSFIKNLISFRPIITEEFEDFGEVRFREIERELLIKLLNKKDVFVLSLGGGTPCYFDNMEIIQKNTNYSFYINLNSKVLAKRLYIRKSTRPLISSIESEQEMLNFINKHLFERNPFYLKAKHIIYCDDMNAKKTSKSILEILEKNSF